MKNFFKNLGNGIKALFELTGDAVALVVEGGARLFGMEKTADKIKDWRKEDNSWKIVAAVAVAAVVVLSVGALAGAGGAYATFGSAASTAGSAVTTAGSWAWGGAKAAASWAAPAFGTGGFFSTPGGGALLATGLQMTGAYFGAEAERTAAEDAQANKEKEAAAAKAEGEANASRNSGVLAGASRGGYSAPQGYTPPSASQIQRPKGLMDRSSSRQSGQQTSSNYRQTDQRSSYSPTDSNGKDNYYDYSTNAWSQR